MGKNGLLITLGTRDIKLDIEGFQKTSEKKNSEDSIIQAENLCYPNGNIINPRAGGSLILENYKFFRKHLIMPIIEPCLVYLSHRVNKLDYIFLIATDQSKDEQISENFKNKDTVSFAEIISLKLKENLKNFFSESSNIQTFLVEKYPNYLDHMFESFSNEIKLMPLKQLRDCDKVYLLNQGGIDGVNTSLMLNCLNHYGHKVEVLSVNENTKTCETLTFAHQYLNEFTDAKLQAALNFYNYPSIIQLDVHEDIISLAKYAEHRLNFDFDAANACISDFKDKEIRTILIKELNEIKADELKKLTEVYANSKIKYKQEAYIDFLFRMFRITEGLPQYYVCKELDFYFNKEDWPCNFKSILKDNEQLRLHIEKQKIGNEPLDINRTPTRQTWLSILSFFENYKELISLLKKIESLGNLRNETIGAHGFNPVSKKMINRILKNSNLSINDVFAFFDKVLDSSNPFDDINQLIRKRFGTK